MQLTIKRSNHAPLIYGLRRKYSKIVINGSGNIHQIWHIFLLFFIFLGVWGSKWRTMTKCWCHICSLYWQSDINTWLCLNIARQVPVIRTNWSTCSCSIIMQYFCTIPCSLDQSFIVFITQILNMTASTLYRFLENFKNKPLQSNCHQQYWNMIQSV